jgi:stage V sporulation protein G
MKTMDVEVVDIRKITGDGKLKAFADVKIGDHLIIKGFCVMEGKNGVFVSMPRKASKDGRWFDVVDADESFKRELEQKVLESYDRETDGVRR